MLLLHCKNQGCLAAILVLFLRVEIVVVGSLLDERFWLPELVMVLAERISHLELNYRRWVVIFIPDETRDVALAGAGTKVAADGSWLVEKIVHGTCRCTCLSPDNVSTSSMGCARDGGFLEGKIPALPSRRRAYT